MEIANKERDSSLDILKGLGILLVYLGHTSWSGSLLFRVIFFVHMPLFFMVSGMLFDPARYRTMLDVVKKSVIGLIVPYLFFAAVAYVIKFDIQMPLLVSRFPTQAYGLLVRGDCIWALWFLVCLASTRVVYYLMYRLGIERNGVLRLLAIFGTMLLAELSLAFLYPYRKAIPLMLSSVPAAMFFFSIGRWMEPLFDKMKKVLSNLSVGIFVGLVSLTLCVALAIYLPVRTFDLRNGVFAAWGLLPCFSGLLSLTALASLLGRWDGRIVRTLMFIGQYSLIFFAMEQNASHIFTWLVRACGFDAPEGYYSCNGMVGLKDCQGVVLHSRSGTDCANVGCSS